MAYNHTHRPNVSFYPELAVDTARKISKNTKVQIRVGESLTVSTLQNYDSNRLSNKKPSTYPACIVLIITQALLGQWASVGDATLSLRLNIAVRWGDLLPHAPSARL